MEIRNLKYSTRNGFSVELFEPDSIRLTLPDLILILLFFGTELSQEDLDEAFLPEEQEILHKYHQLKLKNIVKGSARFEADIPAKVLYRELKGRLEYAYECIRAGWVGLRGDWLKWKVLEPTPRNIIDEMLKKEFKNSNTYEHIIESIMNQQSKFGPASPHMLKIVRARYPALFKD
jgi:hypothetical protein